MRFELFFIVVAAGLVGLWWFELNALRRACWAETDLMAGQFLTIEDLGGPDAKSFVGSLLNRPKKKGETITATDVSRLQKSQAVVAVQVPEKQLPLSTLEIGTCVDAWSGKPAKIVAKGLKVVSIGATSNAVTTVLFLISRGEAEGDGLPAGEELGFAIVACPDALKPDRNASYVHPTQ